MEYLIRFAQAHESFRKPEIEALAALGGIDIEFLVYHEHVCLNAITRLLLSMDDAVFSSSLSRVNCGYSCRKIFIFAAH